MKLEEILSEWQSDSKIDPSNLGNEAIKIPSLHNKYYKIYVNERLFLRKYQEEAKQLKLAKYEFYTMGPTEESMEKGWVLPPRGKLLKQDVQPYIDADSDIVKMNLKIGMQQEKIELLDSIIKSLTNRGFQIKTAVDWAKFQVGAY